MKKIFYLFLLLTLPVLISCSDKDDDEPVNFVWDGDWNDPEHPKYNGYYNPIEGLWQRISNPERGLYFSEDFKAYVAFFNKDGSYTLDLWRTNYEINDQAYKLATVEIWRYKIEKDKLYIYPNKTDNKNPDILVRVEE